MIPESPRPRCTRFLLFSVISVFGMCVFVTGCGTVQETTDDWAEAPPVSATARFEYKIDSLMNENRRLKQQLDAMATENRNLTARAAELETRLNEALSAPKVPVTPQPRPILDATTGYSNALALYRKRDFSGAITQFEALLNGGIRDDLKDNCHYWIGESYYGLGKYREAIGKFETVLGFPRSGKMDDAQLMIGNCHLALGNRQGARDAYNKVISNYPTSPYVRKAQEKLSRL